MRILALTKYDARAASTRQRLLQFIPYLESHGVHIEVAPLLSDEYLTTFANGGQSGLSSMVRAYFHRLRAILRIRSFDAVWVQYETFPYLPSVFERIVALFGRPIICDYDDAIFHQYNASKNLLVRAILGTKLAPLLRRASLCICGNVYIQKYVNQYCPNTVVIPTIVDTDLYQPLTQNPEVSLTVGWIGSPSTWSYVEPLLHEILPCIAEAGAKFRAVGAGPRALGLPGVEAIDWTEESEVSEVQSFDIGIMPLPDEQWARGKCGYKLIQYMACGIPVIASPVGVNVDIVADGENGFLAQNPHDWRTALNQLLADSPLRQKLGKNGRQRVVDRYSLHSQQRRLLAALSQLDINNAILSQ